MRLGPFVQTSHSCQCRKHLLDLRQYARVAINGATQKVIKIIKHLLTLSSSLLEIFSSIQHAENFLRRIPKDWLISMCTVAGWSLITHLRCQMPEWLEVTKHNWSSRIWATVMTHTFLKSNFGTTEWATYEKSAMTTQISSQLGRSLHGPIPVFNPQQSGTAKAEMQNMVQLGTLLRLPSDPSWNFRKAKDKPQRLTVRLGVLI